MNLRPAAIASNSFQNGKQEVKGNAQEIDTEAKNVLYLSFDFDGCLAHLMHTRLPGSFSAWQQQAKIEYIQKNKEKIAKEILQDNLALLKKIIADEAKNHDKIVVMLGSNRQSFYRDLINAVSGGGSSFPVLELIVDELKKQLQAASLKTQVVLDTSTLAGTYFTNKQPGQSNEGRSTEEESSGSSAGYETCKQEFAKSPQELHSKMAEIENTFSTHTVRKDAEWLFDHTKISLIYHQIQRARQKNPNAKINFHFYDDKFADILLPLQQFFKANPQLIPKGVTLYLHNYTGNPAFLNKDKLTPITGEGDPDPNYKDTLIALGAIALKDRNVQTQKGSYFLTYIPEKYNFNFPPESKDKTDEEIRVRIKEVKKYVHKAARHGRSIGLHDAPDVKLNASVYPITVDDLIKARKLSARAGSAKELAKKTGSTQIGLFAQHTAIGATAGRKVEAIGDKPKTEQEVQQNLKGASMV